MDRLVARFREIADGIELYKDAGWEERAAYFRGHADDLERNGRPEPVWAEVTDY